MSQIRLIAVSGSVPTVNQLAVGDIAINSYDGRAFLKKVVGSNQTVVEIGTAGGGSSISASYAVSASHATTAVTASYFSGSITDAISASYAATASYAESALNAQDILVYVKNQSGYTISKGMVVRITGSNNSSDIPRVVTASYENDNNSANTLGIANETITNGNEGFVMTEGVLKGIDTNVYISGQLIYLGATGSITGSAPRAPFHSVRLGEVIRHQSNNGSIYVRIDNGYELGELHDVLDNTTSGSYGDLLVKSGSVWTNSRQLTGSYTLTGSLAGNSFSGSFSGSGANLSGIPASGITGLNLSQIATGSITASVSTGTGSFTVTSGSTNLLFISSSRNIGIGTSTPSARLNVDGTTLLQGGQTTVRGAGATSATTTFLLQNSTPLSLVTVLDNGQFAYTTPTMSLAASQSAYVLNPTVTASNAVGGQYYGVNITPTFYQTTASQTETAFRVAATFITSSAAAVSGSNIIADFGATSVGSQLTVTDVTSGSIYLVNDVSGLPIIEATSDWTVNMYNFPNVILQKTGSQVNINGTLRVTGSYLVTGSTFISSSNATQLRVGSNLLFISSSGNVGIGTTAPTQKLDIAGAVSISGSVLDYRSATSLIAPITTTNVVSFTPGTTFAAFVDYVIKDSSTGANQRVGTIQISISLAAASAVINEVTTVDIGNTSAISFNISYGAPTWLTATNSGATPYDIRYIIRYF